MQGDTTKHLHVKTKTLTSETLVTVPQTIRMEKNSQINTHQHKQMYFVSPISEFSFLHFLTHLCSFVLHPVRITAAFSHGHKNVPHSQ